MIMYCFVTFRFVTVYRLVTCMHMYRFATGLFINVQFSATDRFVMLYRFDTYRFVTCCCVTYRLKRAFL